MKYQLAAAIVAAMLSGCDVSSPADQVSHQSPSAMAEAEAAPTQSAEPATVELAQAPAVEEKVPDRAEEDETANKRVESKPLDEPAGAKRLHESYRIWVDPAKNQVIVDGEICFRRGLLEMFACPKKTKEHESIVAVDSKAYLIHAALLALGLEPGTPVAFRPEYRPATGTEIDVTVQWLDTDGKQRDSRAQEWIRNIKTRKVLESPWVFVGSGFWVDDVTKEQHYMAEGGDLICVSNFPTAMMDLPIDSSQINDDLMFEAFTERIPPLGTKVRLILTPKIEKKSEGKAAQKTEKIIDRSTSDAPK